MSINIDYLKSTYFCFDEPVPYYLQNKEKISIYPVKLKDSFTFLYSYNILDIDKNSMPNVEIIQMSYLQFLVEYVCSENENRLKFGNLLKLCLHLDNPYIQKNEFGKFIIIDKNNDNIIINSNDFDNIKRIILYQNLLHYDDEYINPELKKVMDEMDELKNKQYEMPNLERKISIITALTGINKEEQKNMTLRTHTSLFEEIKSEIDFLTIRPIAILTGNGDKIEHWIYRKKKNKFDSYIEDVDNYAKSMGNEHNAILQSHVNNSNQYLQKFSEFKK